MRREENLICSHNMCEDGKKGEEARSRIGHGPIKEHGAATRPQTKTSDTVKHWCVCMEVPLPRWRGRRTRRPDRAKGAVPLRDTGRPQGRRQKLVTR
jgi:hypothetical protein